MGNRYAKIVSEIDNISALCEAEGQMEVCGILDEVSNDLLSDSDSSTPQPQTASPARSKNAAALRKIAKELLQGGERQLAKATLKMAEDLEEGKDDEETESEEPGSDEEEKEENEENEPGDPNAEEPVPSTEEELNTEDQEDEGRKHKDEEDDDLEATLKKWESESEDEPSPDSDETEPSSDETDEDGETKDDEDESDDETEPSDDETDTDAQFGPGPRMNDEDDELEAMIAKMKSKLGDDPNASPDGAHSVEAMIKDLKRKLGETDPKQSESELKSAQLAARRNVRRIAASLEKDGHKDLARRVNALGLKLS